MIPIGPWELGSDGDPKRGFMPHEGSHRSIRKVPMKIHSGQNYDRENV